MKEQQSFSAVSDAEDYASVSILIILEVVIRRDLALSSGGC